MVVQEALSLLTKVPFPRPEQAPTGSQPGQDGTSRARGRDWREDEEGGHNCDLQSSGPPPTLSVTHLSCYTSDYSVSS